MRVIPTAIADVLIIEPRVFGDSRGFFLESFNRKAFGPHPDLTWISCRIIIAVRPEAY
jgi:dTDP-4-dehydrorhamnose 3,5-epimerase-like enzyme